MILYAPDCILSAISGFSDAFEANYNGNGLHCWGALLALAILVAKKMGSSAYSWAVFIQNLLTTTT